MFDLINGIPVHPLVVHAVVVLLPLAVVGTIAIAVRPTWRVKYGPLVVASALLATVLCPVATSSGEALEERVGDVGEHAEMGDLLVWFAIPLTLAVTALWWLARRQERAETDAGTSASSGKLAGVPVGSTGARRAAPSKTLVTAVAALAVVAALANAFQVYRVGDSGAKAVWEDSTSSTTGG